MLYVSDHGESLGEYGVFLHGLPYPLAPEAQKHVPMIAWLGDDIARRGDIDRACMSGRLDAKLSHDHLYHSVLGLLDVATPTYRSDLDIWGACRASRVSRLVDADDPGGIGLSADRAKLDSIRNPRRFDIGDTVGSNRTGAESAADRCDRDGDQSLLRTR